MRTEERQVVVVADCTVGLAPTDPKAERAGPHCSLICILLRKLRVVKVASGGIHDLLGRRHHKRILMKWRNWNMCLVTKLPSPTVNPPYVFSHVQLKLILSFWEVCTRTKQ